MKSKGYQSYGRPLHEKVLTGFSENEAKKRWEGYKQDFGVKEEPKPETKRVYHRYTNSESPMSDAGFAMFAEDQTKVDEGTYGAFHHTVDVDSIPEEKVVYAGSPKFQAALKSALEEEGESNVDELVKAANPDSIVDSAELWDDMPLVQLVWDKVMEPNGWTVVETDDGAVVFDEALINTASQKKEAPQAKAEAPREDPRVAATGILSGGKVKQLEDAGFEIGWADDIGEIKKGSDAYYDVAGVVAGKADRFFKAGLSVKKKAEAKPAQTLRDKFIRGLTTKGSARAGNVDYKILQADNGGFYFEKVEGGVRHQKGPDAPARWTRAEAIDRALKDAEKFLTSPEKSGKIEEKAPPKKAVEMSADDLLAEWDRQAKEIEPAAPPELPPEAAPAAPKQKAEEAAQHIANALDKFKQINQILGEEGAISDKEVDPGKWELIRPLLKEAWDEVVAAGKSGAEFVKLAIKALSPKGRPYFEKFVREEINNGEVEPGRPDRMAVVESEGGVPSDVQTGGDLEEVSGRPARSVRRDQEEGGTGGGVLGQAGGPREPGTGSDRGTGVEPRGAEGRGGEGAPERQAGNEGEGLGGRPAGEQEVPEEDRNHVIEAGDVLAPAGAESKIKANIKAIALLKKLESENRNPTREEKKVLAQYVGWGAFAQKVFNRDFTDYIEKHSDIPEDRYFTPDTLKRFHQWKAKYGNKLHPNLGGALTAEEWKSARASTTNAHYTSRPVITATWDIARRLGFKGGTILEPAGGVGHFFGLMPQDIASKSILHGIEKDSVSGRIFQKLYPQAQIEVAPFERSKRVLDNSVDLVISNFPFGNVPITDKAHPDYSKWSIHNYFFGRSLSAVKPGGLVIAITSAWSLDAQTNGKVREYIGNKADFLGAIRLPNTAFKANAGTEVVTDIVILRKKAGGEQGLSNPFRTTEKLIITAEDKQVVKKYEDAREAKKVADRLKATRSMTKKQKDEIKLQKAIAKEELAKARKAYGELYAVNEYFVAHPEMVLGKHSKGGSMWAANTYTVEPTGNLEEQLKKAKDALPENVVNTSAELTAPPQPERWAGEGAKEGTLTIEDGEVLLVKNGRLVAPYYRNSAGKKMVVAGKRLTRLRHYLAVRETARTLIDRMAEPDATNEEIASLQRELNRAYDRFTSKYKHFHSPGNSFIRKTDNDFAIVSSLEIVRKKDLALGLKTTTVKKADIFTKRTIYPFVEPDSAKNLEDAVSQSIIYRGKIDPARIATLLGGMDVKKVVQDIVEGGHGFVDPDTGMVVPAAAYLSGNVKRKLRIAKAAATQNPQYKPNIKALEKVIPADLDIEFINFRLGSTWLPGECVADFLRDVLDLTDATSTGKLTVEQVVTDETSRWHITNVGNTSNAKNTRTWGVPNHFTGAELVEAALNFKRPKAMEQDPDTKKKYENKERSKEARLKSEELNAEFVRWAKSHERWADELAAIYNEEKNGTVLQKRTEPNIDYYPNASHAVKLRSHQKIAVSRGLQESVLLAYGVGTGKTFIYITLSQEMKRIGTARKPMIVVHNSTIDQYRESFATLYPGAKVLIPAADERNSAQRKRLLASIATGDWDAVVIPQSFFDRIANDPQREAAYVEERIAELEAEIERAREEDDSEWTVKDVENLVEKKRQQLDALLDRAKDEELYFEQLGVDALLIDEAHAYKRSEFITKLSRLKGIDTGSAQRSTSLLLKAGWIREKTGGKNIILATGTPISNTMAELWTMTRYVRPDLLEEYGVSRFDDFAGAFGEVVEGIEETASGFKEVERFAKYVNGPELLTMFFSGADVRLTKDAGLNLPKVEGGKPTPVVTEKSPELSAVINQIVQRWRAWENLGGREKARQRHVPLQLYGLAKKAAIDLRLIDPDYYKFDPNSKVGRAVEKIAEVWEETKERRSTQIVFLDLFHESGDTKGFNLHRDIRDRLIAKGIPANEIVLFGEISEKKQEQVKDKIRSGEIRVVIGSTGKLGIGVDIARKLIAAHHLNVPDRPMDIEQRNGRIIRQGNENSSVRIFHYMTKDTLDSVMFDRLGKKQRFADQVLSGDIEGREFDDPFSEEQASFAEFAAAASGEAGKLLFEKNDLIAKEHKYRVAESAHIRQISEARRDIKRIPDEIRQKEARRREQEDLRGILNKAFPEGTPETITYKGSDLPKKEFLKRIQEDIESEKARLKKRFEGMTFGKYREILEKKGLSSWAEFAHSIFAKAGPIDIEITLQLATNHDGEAKPSAKIEFIRTNAEQSAPPIIRLPRFAFNLNGKFLHWEAMQNIPARFTKALNTAVGRVSATIERLNADIEDARKYLKELEHIVQQKFKYSKELNETRRRIREIDAELIKLNREAQDREAEALEAAVAPGITKLSIANVRPWPKDFPHVLQHTTAAKLKRHPDYDAAKAGDTEAAARVAMDLTNKEKAKELGRKYPNAVLAPVIAMEEGGINKLPLLLAKAISKVSGLPVDLELYQANFVGRTKKTGLQRLLTIVKFGGKVKAKEYILVDDVVTQGGTFAEQRHYIENDGGKVVATTSFGTAQYGAKLAVTPESIAAIERRFGRAETEALLREYDIAGALEALTQGQAQQILKFSSLNNLRNRIVEEGYEAVFPPGGQAPSGLRINRPAISQAISSAWTSLNQIPGIFKRIRWAPGTVNIDIGGGRYDKATNFLEERGVTNLVYDPYNRSPEFNEDVVKKLRDRLADTATVANVLNVIAERPARLDVIRQTAKGLKPDGVAYFQIHEGNGSGKGKATTKGWQNNRKAAEYLDEVKTRFADVSRSGNVITAKNPIKTPDMNAWETPEGEVFFNYGNFIAKVREANPEGLEWLRKQILSWLKGPLPKEALERLSAHLVADIAIKGRSVAKTKADWRKLNVGSNAPIMGATTITPLQAIIELSYNFDDPTIERTTRHELFHLAMRWLLPEQDYQLILKAFDGNEEAAAEAFADFAIANNKKGLSAAVIKLFRRLRLALKRVRAGLQGKGFRVAEDVFRDLLGGKYAMLPEGERIARHVGGSPDIRYQVAAWQGGPREVVGGYSNEFLGTGEGVHAFGWGHYFSELEDIAKFYATALAPKPKVLLDGEPYNNGTYSAILPDLFRDATSKDDVVRSLYSDYGKLKDIDKDYADKILDIAKKVKNGRITVAGKPRHFHKVTIHKGKDPSEYTWLDWDKKVPDNIIQKVLSQAKTEFGEKLTIDEFDLRGLDGHSLYYHLTQEIADAYNRKAGVDITRPSYKEASLFLLRAGIDGIRYPAGSLSGMETDAKNYVVFDPNAVTIEEHTAFSLASNDEAERRARAYLDAFIAKHGGDDDLRADVEEEADRFDEAHRKDALDAWDTIRNLKAVKGAYKEGRPDTTAWERLLSVPSHYFHRVPALGRVFEDALRKADNQHMILDQITMSPDGDYYTTILDELRKQDPAEYKKLKKYLKHCDQNQIGYRISQDEESGAWRLHDKKNPELILGTYKTEQAAVDAMIDREVADYRESGRTEQAAEALRAARRITTNGFNILIQSMRTLIEDFQQANMELPSDYIYVQGEAVQVNLKTALAQMGDMRGYYMPRIRKPGRYTVRVKKKGANPILRRFDLKTTAEIWAARKKSQGYTVVSIEKSRDMPEDVFEMAKEVIAQQAIINEALERMDRSHKKIDDKELKKITEGAKVLFAKGLVEQVANIIKGRGVRMHMIRRVEATGTDVWEGYEEDPTTALAKYAQGLAGGESKKIMARDMLLHFTGTDISWGKFKQDNPEAEYKDYLKFVKDRGVDAVDQKNAFRDGKSYMAEMLRNDEAVDRLIGTIKGVAVLKYLGGRVSAPLVNLTALATSVPACMNGFGDIPLHKTLKYLGQAMDAYWEWRFEDKTKLDPEIVKVLRQARHGTRLSTTQ
ncbi:MAG: DEAD/DEAH box helicase family protein [Deltaproteobacteria bacterium]|nr:DEAD/DEAH box helicase family protein [Deltaproteobacteria bacterium]